MTTLNNLFPEKGKLILTGGGRGIVDKLGIEAVRQVTLSVLCGENVRSRTELLTRRRLSIATGALVTLFAKGWAEIDDFTDQISEIALSHINARRSDKALKWPAYWLIGLTGKANQNVLRGGREEQYIREFEIAVEEASRKCEEDFGSIRMSLGFVEDEHGEIYRHLDWKDITRLTTAIGCATTTIRGSEKSIYGKLFEKLVLGSVLHILGFQYSGTASSNIIDRAFWLSDSSDVRECDATVRLRAGKLARFDIGFIGSGNPEITKDKLTRFASEVELYGKMNTSQTFIIVDKIPEKSKKTLEAAERAGSEIVQMSMQFWPQELAKRLESRLDYRAEILSVREDELRNYLTEKIQTAPLLNFLNITESLSDEVGELEVTLPDDSLLEDSEYLGENDSDALDE